MMKETKIFFQIDFESLLQLFSLFMIFVRVWMQEGNIWKILKV